MQHDEALHWHTRYNQPLYTKRDTHANKIQSAATMDDMQKERTHKLREYPFMVQKGIIVRYGYTVTLASSSAVCCIKKSEKSLTSERAIISRVPRSAGRM